MERFGIHKKLGFGCMRLPMKDGEIDTALFCRMVDRFLEEGYNYFDTAHGYHSGKSETALRACLTSRHPRDAYLLTDKLTAPYFKTQADIRPFFESQLAACGVTYFDFYLMHAQNRENFEHFKACRAYETAFELKKEGKIRHVGISFHDSADTLEKILQTYPAIEVVQIQYNYVDYDSPVVESRRCFEVCRKYGKPVIVMEPVKGGLLAKLPKAAAAAVKEAGLTPAALALRFAAAPEEMLVVLSGMSTPEQVEENTTLMKTSGPLTAAETGVIERVLTVLAADNGIACTACRYCVDGCPKRISIPDLFTCYNAKRRYKGWNADFYYRSIYTKDRGKASDCVGCGRCEKVCPQHLPIRDLLVDVATMFEK